MCALRTQSIAAVNANAQTAAKTQQRWYEMCFLTRSYAPTCPQSETYRHEGTQGQAQEICASGYSTRL